MGEFDGKAVIVTGAASGMGTASARLFASRGAGVVVADVNGEGAENVTREIVSGGGRAVAVTADVSDESQVAAMVEAAVSNFGRLDVLHNNAALTDVSVMMSDGQVAEADIAQWERVLRVNLLGYVMAAKHSIPVMLKGGGGVIVNISSGTALQAELSRTAYATSKAAIIGLTRNIATQYGPQGIRCVGLALGIVATPSLKANMPDFVQDLFRRQHLLQRFAEPEDIANVVAFMASDGARFITGCTIPVDGGFSAHTPSWVDEIELAKQAGGHG